MDYKTTFKKKQLRVYRIKNNFKCVAAFVLKDSDPKDTKIVTKLQKKFKDIVFPWSERDWLTITCYSFSFIIEFDAAKLNCFSLDNTSAEL